MVELTFEKFFSKGDYFLVTATLFQSLYTGSDGVLRNTSVNNQHTLSVLGGYADRLVQRKRDMIGISFGVTPAVRKWYNPID